MTRTIPLASAETALLKLKRSGDYYHFISLQAALDALRGVAGERDEALELAQEAVEMTGEPDCWHDHNGRCQAHNLQPRGECWVERVKALTERKRDD